MKPESQPADSHPGSHHWTLQRSSSVLLIPLTFWLLWAIVSLAGADYAAAQQFFGRGFNAVMAILLAGIMFYHAQLGIQVVCEDYVYPPWLQSALVWMTRIGCLAGFLAAVYAVFAATPGA